MLAGDILKEASDQALPMVAVGLFYRRGYFRQRLDLNGRQQEYWIENDPKSLPMARVSRPDGRPLKLSVHVFGGETWFQVWRVDVGRVPLYLLDSELPENDADPPLDGGAALRGQPRDPARAVRAARDRRDRGRCRRSGSSRPSST